MELDPSSSLQSHGRRPAVQKTDPLFAGSREEKPNQKGLALREHDNPLYEGRVMVEVDLELDSTRSDDTALCRMIGDRAFPDRLSGG